MVEYDDHEQVAVADIPGLIEGAHQNKVKDRSKDIFATFLCKMSFSN